MRNSKSFALEYRVVVPRSNLRGHGGEIHGTKKICIGSKPNPPRLERIGDMGFSKTERENLPATYLFLLLK